MNDLTTNLYQAWQDSVLSDKIVNEFEASHTDSNGRWIKGERITYGIRSIDGRLTYYAQNLTQSKIIYDAVEEKQVGEEDFICQFNGYRTLRPRSRFDQLGRQQTLSNDPHQCRFYCQDRTKSLSLLVRKPLLQVKLKHFCWKAYYNATPIEKHGHFLWIPSHLHCPDDLPHFPQFLSLEFVEDAILLFNQLANTLVFFNSLHAGASVNHIHFQAIYHRQSLLIEKAPVISYKGFDLLESYLAEAFVFPKDVQPHRIFSCIQKLQTQGIPFNLMLIGSRIILIPRNIEHEVVSEFPGQVLAALGMCGKIVTVDREVYLKVDMNKIKRAFQKMVIPSKFLLDKWEDVM